METMVTLQGGERGVLERGSPLATPGNVVVRLDTGQQVIAPEEALLADYDGGYRLPFTAEEMQAAQHGETGEEVVVPVIAESLTVGKRTVATGGVRLIKRISEQEETVDEPLLRQEVHVERVPINRIVTEAPEARYDGDTLIVPVLEEVLIVEKRLMLKEEIHIKRSQMEVHEPQQVTVRTEDVVIEEIDPAEPR